jgi:hypothetical protein
MAAVGLVLSATPPGVAGPVLPDARETPVARPVRPAAAVEDVVNQDTIVPRLMVKADAARTAGLALVPHHHHHLPLLRNAKLPVGFSALERTSAARPDTYASVTRPIPPCAVPRPRPRPHLTPILRRRLTSHPLPRPRLVVRDHRRPYSLPPRLRVPPHSFPPPTRMDLVLRHLLFRSWSTLSSPCSSVLGCSPSSSKQNLRLRPHIDLAGLVIYPLFLYTPSCVITTSARRPHTMTHVHSESGLPLLDSLVSFRRTCQTNYFTFVRVFSGLGC